MKKISFILMIFLFIIFWFFYFNNDKKEYLILPKKILGSSMLPMLSSGSVLDLIVDYYKYNEPRRWDIVWYDYWWNKHMLIKIVKITSDDIVYVSWSNLIVNDFIMVNSKWDVYKFSDQELSVFNMYIKNRSIWKNSFFVFWDNVKDSIDSRKFGAISRNDLLWKFIKR